MSEYNMLPTAKDVSLLNSVDGRCSDGEASANLSQKHNNQGPMPRFFIDIYGVLVPLSVYLTTFVYGSTYGLMHRELFPDLFNINDDPFRYESYASHKLGMAPTIFFATPYFFD